ncbi:MAG TPA: hypothetical protein VFO71_09370, partial [Gemmatimonadales bacterium]|nr:hypothetical protein [Gemmatimonadales bacterium]
MRTGLSQHTSLRQELRVNPRLYQAMDMLYMPMMDLQQHLKQELLANPFLELLEPEEETPEQATAEKEKEQKDKQDEVDWEEILLNGFEVGGTREQYEQLEYTEPVTVESRNLIDHLREQLQMLTLSPRQLLLAEEFLGNINEEGYLAASLEDIVNSVNLLLSGHVGRGGEDGEDGEGGEDGDGSPVAPGGFAFPTPPGASANSAAPASPSSPPSPASPTSPASPSPSSPPFYTLQEAEEMLAIIQRLDPSGTGARDLRECLLIQLVELADTSSLTYRLVFEAFPDLIAHRWNDLAKRFGVEPAAVQTAADQLSRLDPKPGLK